MGRITLYSGWIFLLLFTSKLASAQGTISVNASVDKNEILIGERITLSLDVKVSLGFNPSWFPLDTLPHFEFIDKGKIDSAVTEDYKSYHQQILLTSFDSGTHAIPRLPVVIGGKSFLTDSIPVTVKFTPVDEKQDYHDIKDILDVKNPYAKFILWSVVAGTLMAAGLVIYFITRKQKPKPAAEPAYSLLPPYEEAVQALEDLKKQGLPSRGETKLFYSRLNDILRWFIFRKLAIASMSKTNEELILQLKELRMSGEQFSRLSQALRISDFVKFAKYLPDENDNERNFAIIKSSVDLLNEITQPLNEITQQ